MKKIKAKRSERQHFSIYLTVMKEQATLLFEGRAKWVEREQEVQRPCGRGLLLRKERSPVWLVCNRQEEIRQKWWSGSILYETVGLSMQVGF